MWDDTMVCIQQGSLAQPSGRPRQVGTECHEVEKVTLGVQNSMAQQDREWRMAGGSIPAMKPHQHWSSGMPN